LIYHEGDKNNQNLDRAMMGRFRRWINDLSLKEIPLHGCHYTWSNGRNDRTLVKLDRAFCSVEWEGLFPDCLLHSSASQDSDHCPLILGLHDIKRGKKRFYFEAFWTKFEGFQEVVASAWAVVPTGACPLLTLSAKLKATARGLQGWSKKRVGHVASQLELAKELLHQLEVAQDSRSLSPSETWLHNNLKKHCLALASSKTIARLRSRIGWTKEGDANTALFHSSARYCKGKNFISSMISREGQTLTSHEDKVAEFADFYNGLLGTFKNRDITIHLDALGGPFP
jgi:hypothetical protein